VSGDLWLLGCYRSLDSAAPGDWTIQIRRAPDGSRTGLVIGCWLARKVGFSLT
jgi:D-aminopeptidase